MKKIFISIIGILIYFILFSRVEAAGTVSLSASKTSVNVGDTFNVSINLSGASIATLTARISFDTQKVSYVSGPNNSNFLGGRVIYTWTDSTGGSAPLTGGTIATFTFKAKEAGNVNFAVSGNFFTPDETSANPSFSGTTVNIKSTGGDTGGGTDGTTGSSGGNTGGSTGENTGGSSGGNIGGNQGGNNAGNGNQNGGTQTGSGNTGTNTGESNSGNTGTNNPPPAGNTNNTGNNQQNTKSSNNNIKSLQLDTEGISPAFNKNKTQYYIIIPNEILNINVTAVPEDSKSTVQISGNKNIPEGNSRIIILVTAENGNKKEYFINVTKTNNPELSNSNLENLAIENATLTPEFNADVTDYIAEISSEITQLNILAVPQNVNAQVRIVGNENLQIGENTITITVLAQDGQTSKIYNIVVNKSEDTSENKAIDENEQGNNINQQGKVSNESVDRKIKNNAQNINILSWIIIISILVVSGIVIIVVIKKKNIFRGKNK